MPNITEKDMQQKPTTKDIWLVDGGARGSGRLVGRITSHGGRFFYYRYTNSEQKRDRLLIGPFESKGDGQSGFTVQQARDRAREWSVLHRSGVKNLREHFIQLEEEQQKAQQHARAQEEARQQAEAREIVRKISVRKLFEKWRITELQPGSRADGSRSGRKDGGAYVSAQFERHVFPVIGDIPACELKKGDLLQIIDAQKAKNQLRTASVLLSDLRQMLTFALDRDIIDANPLATIKKFRVVGADVERDRVLSEAEIQHLAYSLPKARLNVRSRIAIWLILATGVRVGELMGAVWAGNQKTAQWMTSKDFKALQEIAIQDGVKLGIVDTSTKTWHLLDTKNQRPHTIHLSDFALGLFEELRTIRPCLPDSNILSPWVFPARDVRRPVCVKSFGKQLADRQREPGTRMSGRSKQTDSLTLANGRWTAHDLRRTAGTLMARLGVSGDVIDEALNHMIESRVRRTYIHDRRQAEQIQAFDALGNKLQELKEANRE